MSAGQTNLLTSWEEQEESLEGGFKVTRISIGGDRHAMALLGAVIARYNEYAERPKPTAEDLEALIGNQVTLVLAGENMLGGGLLTAQEAKLFASSSGLGYLPKGARSKGYRLKPENVLDVLPGYDTAAAIELTAKVRRHFPVLKPLTQERLKELPTNSETLSLCMFGRYPMPDQAQPDALYLASEYWPEDDIVEGVLLVRPEVGISENGSCYGRTFTQGVFGEVEGFEPISFAEGIHLCNLEFEEAYEQIMANLGWGVRA